MPTQTSIRDPAPPGPDPGFSRRRRRGRSPRWWRVLRSIGLVDGHRGKPRSGALRRNSRYARTRPTPLWWVARGGIAIVAVTILVGIWQLSRLRTDLVVARSALESARATVVGGDLSEAKYHVDRAMARATHANKLA